MQRAACTHSETRLDQTLWDAASLMEIQTRESAQHRWKFEILGFNHVWPPKVTVLFTDGKSKSQATFPLCIHTVVFRVSWHLSTFRRLLRCPLFSCARFSYAHFVRESNQIFFIFQIQQNPRSCIENETFQWTLEIKYMRVTWTTAGSTGNQKTFAGKGVMSQAV